MSRNENKLIITCAVTGSVHTPTMSPHLPVSPEEIIDEAVRAGEAGASVVHIHVRDPETGEPSSDLEIFREVLEGIKERSDVIICPSTGGGVGMSVKERIKVVPELEPEMASFNMGSMNFCLAPALKRFDEFKYDWEREYIESSKDHVFKNTFEDLEKIAQTFYENNTKPELECYDVGQIYNASHLFQKGVLKSPLHMQFVLGTLGGIGTDLEDLTHMKRTADKAFGEDYTWSTIGPGKYQYKLCTHGLLMGGHTRVGMEDNLYLEKGKLAESNADMVAKMSRIAKELGREPATPEETRELLGLKGQENVNF